MAPAQDAEVNTAVDKNFAGDLKVLYTNPIQSNAFRRAQVVLFARILHTFDHIQIGILPVPIRSALKSNKTS